MGLWIRKFTCAICDKNVIFDAHNNTIKCGCGVFVVAHLTAKQLLDNFYLYTPWTIGEAKHYKVTLETVRVDNVKET